MGGEAVSDAATNTMIGSPTKMVELPLRSTWKADLPSLVYAAIRPAVALGGGGPLRVLKGVRGRLQRLPYGDDLRSALARVSFSVKQEDFRSHRITLHSVAGVFHPAGSA